MEKTYALEGFYNFFETNNIAAVVIFAFTMAILVLGLPLLSFTLGGFMGWTFATYLQRGSMKVGFTHIGCYFGLLVANFFLI